MVGTYIKKMSIKLIRTDNDMKYVYAKLPKNHKILNTALSLNGNSWQYLFL